MTATVGALYRHPIKGHGRERLQRVSLIAGQTMPGDRIWAVANQMAKVTPGATQWAVSANFSRGSKCPGLMAIDARLDEAAGTVTLTHPQLGEITVNPDQPSDAWRLIDWTAPMMPSGEMTSEFVVRADRGMTDTDFASVSINTTASLAALSRDAGQDLSPLRWRGNIWLDGTRAWEEFDWIGQTIRIGTAVIEIKEPILRCTATMANPDSGERDVDTLALLRDTYGHQDFGVYGVVTQDGDIAVGDKAQLV